MAEDNKYKISMDKNGNILKLANKKDGLITDSGSIENKKLKEIQESNFIQDSSEMGWLTKFSRFNYVDPYNTLTGNKEYIFITKPDLHLFNNFNTSSINPELANDVFFSKSCFERYRHVMKQLQYSVNKSQPFLTMLSNSVTSSLEIPTISGLESETSENIYGDKITYRHGSESSDVGFEFSLEFEETKWLEIYHLFKMWDRYYEMKSKGQITPPSEDYIRKMELHDQVSMYKIIVADDMETILFYAKYYGVYPKNVPRDAFGSLDDGSLKITVDFKSSFVIDNDPMILYDLNYLSSIGEQESKPTKFAKIWDKDNDRINYEWVGKPFIILDKSIPNGQSKTGSMGRYKLKWREA